MVESRSGSGGPDPDQLRAWVDAGDEVAMYGLARPLAERGDAAAIAELRARAEAGDRDAAGRLGEELAGQGDPEGALQVWARAYGDDSPTTRRLAELLAEEGDLDGALSAWKFSDAVHQNPAGTHAEYLDTLDDTARMEMDDEPEDWAFIESEQVARLLAERAERGDAAAWEELRARADGWAGGPAGKQLARLLAERGDEPSE